MRRKVSRKQIEFSNRFYYRKPVLNEKKEEPKPEPVKEEKKIPEPRFDFDEDKFLKKLSDQLNSKKEEPKPEPIKEEKAEVKAESKPEIPAPSKEKKERKPYQFKNPEKYKCEACGKGFPTPQTLWFHKMNKHKPEENKDVK